jgi:zinc/manganese transport system substrate-binding protein
LVAVVALLTVPPSNAPAASAQDDAPLRVVATFSILADWVEEVGGDRIEVVTIVPAGGDAHTFDPNPDQVSQIADADLIFEIGAGFETWLDDMYAASGSEARRVVVTDGLDLIGATEEGHDHEGEEAHEHEEEHASESAGEASPAAEEEHEHEHQHTGEGSPAAEGEHEHEGEGEDDHEHGEVDPHVWHDVSNAIAIVEVIRAELGMADSANALTFDANAEAYTAELTELDAFIREEVARLPEERRKLVTSHDTFAYFARAYGFEVVGTALALTTESGDPPAGEIAVLVEQIESAGVPAIFAENVSNPDLMQAIADEAGVTLAPPLYTDALGEPGSEGGTYVAMMRYNTTTIVTALRAE